MKVRERRTICLTLNLENLEEEPFGGHRSSGTTWQGNTKMITQEWEQLNWVQLAT
jgi:hypothetical protein